MLRAHGCARAAALRAASPPRRGESMDAQAQPSSAVAREGVEAHDAYPSAPIAGEGRAEQNALLCVFELSAIPPTLS
jgi:hypothetical protein